MKKIIIAIVAILILGIGAYLILNNNSDGIISEQDSSSTSTDQQSTTSAPDIQVLEIIIENFAFNPFSVTVKTGTIVRWENKDSVLHTVWSDTGVFGSQNLSNGDSYEFKFDVAGNYDYICSIHPFMKGKVIVTQ